MKLKRINSAIDRVERNKINENFDILERGYGKAFQDSQLAKDQSTYAVETSDEAKQKAESTQIQLDTIVIEGDSSIEAAQARVSTDDTVYTTLKERLDEENKQVTQQLARVDKQVDDAFLNLDTFKRIDGETDDTGLIQRAIDSAFETKKTIFVPIKEFQFSGTLNIRNGVSFTGQKRENSVLKYTGNGLAFNFIDKITNAESEYGFGCYYNTFSDLSIIGPGDTTSSTAIKGELRYSSFVNVTFRQFGTFIDVNNNWTNNYVNCLFSYANVWYKSGAQNNAVTFTACQFGGARIGFQMQSCYEFSVIGGNIEGCTDVVLQPTLHGGCRWSNFNIKNVYLENTSPLIDTDVNAANGNVITSWALLGFKLSESHINFYNTEKSFIKTRINDAIIGTVESCVFYKSDDTNVFDLQSTRLLLANNQYYYFNASYQPIALTNPLTTYMTQWNTSYNETRLMGNNRYIVSGILHPEKGLILSQTLPNARSDGHLSYNKNLMSITLYDGTGNHQIQAVRSGTTAQRYPSSKPIGYQYFDTTLGKPIWWNGTNWVDSTGTTV